MEIDRKAGIELVRFIACSGIIWFHVGAPGSHFTYAGLPIFMILTIAFTVNNTLTIKEQACKSFKRLIIPWIFWSGFYALIKIGDIFLSGTKLSDEFFLWMLATGTSLHLWYLPFAFISIIFVSILKNRNIFIYITKNKYLLVVLSGILLLFISSFFRKMSYFIPLNQWLFILPAIPIGLFFALIIPKSIFKLFISDGLWILFILYLTTYLLNLEGLVIPHFIAVIFCSIVWLNGHPAGNTILKLGHLSYGMYIIHPFIASIIIRSGINNSIEVAVLTIVLASIIIAIVIKTPFRRFL